MSSLDCAGFIFFSNFDSGNLAKVEYISKHESAVVAAAKNGKEILPEIPDIEFNVWTKPDCVGTEYENGNRTWFHFGVKGYMPCVLMKLNLVDLNRQAKMYSQGMAPVYKTVPGRPNWERVRDKATYQIADNIFTLSFKFKTPADIDTIMYFAFTYPYTYTELQSFLTLIDHRFLTVTKNSCDDVYFVRECICNSLEGRRIDLITVSSYYNITNEQEPRLKNLFLNENVPRPFLFRDKKIIFVSARVHPGETPSSFVFNGLLNFLLNREDPLAINLRRMYVFKMIPFLNPDGVFKGHYRTDTRGVNLNRMYLTPTLAEHPSVYAARKLIEYYHCGIDREIVVDKKGNIHFFDGDDSNTSLTNDSNSKAMTEGVQVLSLEENDSKKSDILNYFDICFNCKQTFTSSETKLDQLNPGDVSCSKCGEKRPESGIFMYLDMHGHASKKGIFMYGNHFTDVDRSVECMLLPKIMALNNHNFHFTACNFTERNMYLKDRRDGMSREGSGRVAVLKLTGLVRSYTLECNYNTGRLVNVLPPMVKEGINRGMHTLPLPPKYAPPIFEEVGHAIGISILDLTGHNPHSRIPNSEFHSLNGLREWLRLNCANDLGLSRLGMRHKMHGHNQTKAPRCKAMKNLITKSRSNATKALSKKPVCKSAPIVNERKENMGYPTRDTGLHASQAATSSAFNRPASKGKGLSLRRNAKRDNNTRSKLRLESPKLTNRSCQTSNPSINKLALEQAPPCGSNTQLKDSPKRIKVSPEHNTNSNDRFKLREICIIKENLTKKLIAKFSTDSSSSIQDGTHDDDDDLVVAWDPSYSPKVLSKYGRPTSSYKKYDSYNKSNETASTSNNKTIKQSMRTNSFISAKTKRSKGSLRRLASNTLENAGKIDKLKKRKKLKSKFL